MQRNLLDEVRNHPAFLTNHIQNHNYLLRELAQGHYAISNYREDDFSLLFKDGRNVVKGMVFKIIDGKIRDNSDQYLRTFNDVESYLADIAKRYSVSFAITLNSAINANEKLKQEFAREKSPLIDELRKAIALDNDEDGDKYAKYESVAALSNTYRQLETCIALEDQSTTNLICKMIQDVNFFESGRHVGFTMFDGYSEFDGSNKPDYKDKYTYQDLQDSITLKEKLPNVRQFLMAHCHLKPAGSSEKFTPSVTSFMRP